MAVNLIELGEDFREDMVAGAKLLEKTGEWIAILGSANTPQDDPAWECVNRCGELIVKRLRKPVATGRGFGCMGGGNHGAFIAGGVSVGIFPTGLPTEQKPNPWCTDTLVCKTMLARQHLLLAGALGVIIAPEGGMGTLFEIGHQIIEMRRKHFDPDTPIVIIDAEGAWEGLHKVMEDMVERGFWSRAEYEKLYFCKTAEAAIDHLAKTLEIPEQSEA